MHKSNRIVIIIYLLAFVLLTVGCSKSSLYPKAQIQLTADNPNIIPTSNIVTDISESTITVTLITGVSCSVIGYDLTYKTLLGDDIDSLSVYNIKTELSLTASTSGGDTSEVEESMIIRPYTQGVMDLLQNTTSAISPIRAKVTVHFHDVNDNYFSEEITFLCWKYVSSNE